MAIHGHGLSQIKTAAVVVLYQPEKLKLLRLLDSIRQTVNLVILIDNSECVGELDSVFFKKHYPEMIYLNLKGNFGIATAQNKAIELAKNSHCSHVIFFDQDSTPHDGMIARLLSEEEKILALNKKIGAIGPIYIDEKTSSASKAIQFFAGKLVHSAWNKTHQSSIEVDFIISSGSLIRISVLSEVGEMREDLFIDGVDVEWALRATSKGFKHYLIRKAVMTHNIGDNSVRLGKLKVDVHKELRNFYKIRNLCFLVSHHPYHWRFIISMSYKIPAYIIIYTLLSKSKFRSVSLYCRACTNGFSGTLGKIN
jgi:rhamnosyltransferase